MSAPGAAAPGERSITWHGFTVTTHKQPILKAGPADALAARLGLAPPEMVFGDNAVCIEHAATGWRIDFAAEPALARVDKTGAAMLQVAYSRQWQRHRQKQVDGVPDVVRPFDWSYTTDFAGRVAAPSKGGGGGDGFGFAPVAAPEADGIPVQLLLQRDPILFWDEVPLYEDELADNGTAVLSCKVRVMPARLLLLSRFFLRLDDVVVRVRDTRVYVDFGAARVVREYAAREATVADVRAALAAAGHAPHDVLALLRDPNRLAPLLPTLERTVEAVDLA